MPARRPYASRGVPRRATTRRSGGSSSAAGLATLLGLLALIGLGGVWIVKPWSLPGVIPAPQAPDAGAPGAATPATAASVVEMVGAAAPALTAESATAAATDASLTPSDATPTSVPTLRQWATRAPGVVGDPALVGRLDQALAGIDGQVSVAVKDLGSGRGAVLDGDREMPAASLYKLPVLYSVFDTGLGMGEPLLISDEARSYDAGTLELGVGETLTVAEALERMVTLSDNTAAVMLGSRVGSNRVNATIAALGMERTHYSLERMTTSALDMLRLLDLMARGKAVSAAASSDMLHLLLRQRVNDRLPRLLPDDVQVAHKTGNLPGTVNDVGVVYGPSTTLAVAALISDTSDEAAAATGIARMALAAYMYFDAQPEDVNRPLLPQAPTRPIPPVWRQPRPPTPTRTPTRIPTRVVEPTPEEPPAAVVVESAPTATPARPATVVVTVVPTSPPVTPAPTVAATPRPAPPAPTPTPGPPPPTSPTPLPATPVRTPTRAPGVAAPTMPATATALPPGRR
jgi:beta-lactamase class A